MSLAKFVAVVWPPGNNTSSKNGTLKMMFLFPRWDTLIFWRVYIKNICYIMVFCMDCKHTTVRVLSPQLGTFSDHVTKNKAGRGC